MVRGKSQLSTLTSLRKLLGTSDGLPLKENESQREFELDIVRLKERICPSSSVHPDHAERAEKYKGCL
jgi:hypothetical protein